MRNRNELKKSDNDIFQIKGILEKSSDNKWIQDFVYWLRKFFYMEYWQGEKKDERYAVQMIQLLLKEYLDFLGKGDTAVEEVLRKFEMTLPFLQRLVISDMKAAYEGDPAAESYMEIIAAYPGPLAVLIQRTANCLYKLKVPILPRIMTEYAHSMTGIDIHPGAEIGESFFIDHGTGVVIGETTVIGDYVKIYQGVTLGALSTRGGHKQKSMKRHPTVEDNVTIYAGATVLGGSSGIYVERELEAIEAGRGRMPVVFTSGLGLEENVQDNQYLGTIGYGISQTPQIWLDHQVAERNGELILTWDYVDGLFPDQMIQDMFSCYIKLLKKLCRKEYWSFSVSEMLTVPKSEERTRANRTEKNIPRDTLVSLFMKQVRSSGMESAIISEERVLTYREVDDLSSGLMKAIKNAPMGVGKITAVLMEKSWQQVVAVLGILKAGSAYIPIDATLPKERVKLLLEKSGACTIISQKGIEEKFGTNFNKNWITIESVQAVESNEDNSVFSELAYVIFTSGSTGEPKGVMITHENVMNTILDVNERIDLNQKDRVFALSNLNFDLSVFDIFGVLLVGGAIVIPKQFDIKNPRKWLELIEQHHVTVWNTVPASAEMLIEYANGQGIFQTNIRKVLLSGDWIPVDLPERIRKITKGVEIFSLGGATEGSIWSIIYKIEEGCFFQTSIPYGKPLANQRFYILNERMEECPDMVPGELFISGKGVAKGYWNDPQKTKERFVPDPKVPGEMMYATGDIGRYLKSGDIEFLGREDYQVKVNGYRIELGEIEHYIRLNHAVKDTVVIKGSDNRLVAFLVLTDNQEQLKELLDDWLRSRLPAYMIPSEYIYLKKIPLTPNHKIDKKELLNTIKNETKENRKKMPTTETEKIISSIWEDVLGYADPSVEDDFFSNGGNSLMAVRFVNAINKKMGLELSLQSLFSNSKISEIAALLDKNISEYEDMGSI